MNFSKFENKYIIEGNLVMDNIHIGSGTPQGDVDAPTIRYSNGNAYIPGSSFRGHLRAKLEGLVGLGLKINDRELDELDIKILFGYTNLGEEDQEEVKNRIGLKSTSSSLAGKIHIEDLVIINNKNDVTRDGIAIDRNTGTTKNGAKFDYNVIENANFKLVISLENVMAHELDLLDIAFRMMEEDILGGKTSRGIGKSNLSIEKVKYVESKNDLKVYLFTGKLNEGTKEKLKKGKITL